MLFFENDTIKLRAVEPEDLEILYCWENDTELWALGNTIAPYSKYVMKEFIKNADKDIYETKQLRLMIDLKQDNQTVGCVDIYDFDFFHQKAAVGILVDKTFRNNGIASNALCLLIEYAFSYLKLKQLYGYIPEGNEASAKLFKKVGFVQSGKLINWLKMPDGFVDVLFFQLINKK